MEVPQKLEYMLQPWFEIIHRTLEEKAKYVFSSGKISSRRNLLLQHINQPIDSAYRMLPKTSKYFNATLHWIICNNIKLHTTKLHNP